MSSSSSIRRATAQALRWRDSRVVAASLIWYLTTGIMLVIWYAVYVTK